MSSVISGPVVEAHGVAEHGAVFREIEPQIRKALENSMAQGTRDTKELERVARRTLGRWVARKLRRKPMLVPVVVTD